MSKPPYTIAVMPTANRPEVCLDAIESLYKQVDIIYVIDNGDQRPMPTDTEHAWSHYYVRRYEDERPINLSKVWNRGLDFAYLEGEGMDQFNVIIANDDAIFPAGWVEAVSSTMRFHGAAAASSGYHDMILRQLGPDNPALRMQGWAFMLAGEKGLRADEQFVWWFGDTDLDWQARQAGGTAIVRGFPVENRFANQSTNGPRIVDSQEDRARFEKKWNLAPW